MDEGSVCFLFDFVLRSGTLSSSLFPSAKTNERKSSDNLWQYWKSFLVSCNCLFHRFSNDNSKLKSKHKINVKKNQSNIKSPFFTATFRWWWKPVLSFGRKEAFRSLLLFVGNDDSKKRERDRILKIY